MRSTTTITAEAVALTGGWDRCAFVPAYRMPIPMHLRKQEQGNAGGTGP